MPKGKAKAKAKTVRPKAKPVLDRYAYLPTDLQRAAVFMDRGDFLRKLQKGQHDREYRHVATQGPPPLSADGAKDLQETNRGPQRGDRGSEASTLRAGNGLYRGAWLPSDGSRLVRRTRLTSKLWRLGRFSNTVCANG